MDFQLDDAACPGGRGGDVRSGLLAGAWGLPEHGFAAAGGGEHELGAVLSAAVEDQVDRRATPRTGTDRDAFHDLRIIGPFLAADWVAVQRFGAWPGPGGAEHHPAGQRQAQQVGQMGVRVGITGDQHVVHGRSGLVVGVVARGRVAQRP